MELTRKQKAMAYAYLAAYIIALFVVWAVR